MFSTCRTLAVIVALSLAVCAVNASAESSIVNGQATSARLMFKIVIPSVLIVDTRSGTVFSNDRRAVPMVAAAHLEGPAVPGNAIRSAASSATGSPIASRLLARRLGDNEVLCMP